MNNRLPEINTEDEQIWLDEVKQVTKITQPAEPPSAPIYIDEITPTVNYKNIPNLYQLPPLETGDLSGMDGQTAKRVKRCEYRVEAILDLHGKTEDKAFNAVNNFIKTSYMQNKRCVLIITGKGLTQTENDDIFSSKGKLKESTPRWLNSKPLRPLILGFIHPIDKLGGTGALYIILRKKK